MASSLSATVVLILPPHSDVNWTFTIQFFGSATRESKVQKYERHAASKNSITTKSIPTGTRVVYDFNYPWHSVFGIPLVFVISHVNTEMYLVSMKVNGVYNYVCNSWLYPADVQANQRAFFINNPYLPSQTPAALIWYRQRELQVLRGDGTGVRQEGERIYDYATYNDLGDVDKSAELARPILGGSSDYPYPRRTRTGRPPSVNDPNTESRLPDEEGFSIYVPRDDRFSDQKLNEFLQNFPKSSMSILKPFLWNSLETSGTEFTSFQDLYQTLYKDGAKFYVPPAILQVIAERLPIPPPPADGNLELLFPVPDVIKNNLDGWMTDEEFAREMLAGVNPVSIRLLEDFPIQSTLDRTIYGDQTCRITREQLELNLNGLTVDKALSSKRLFILDHHDAFMPYLRKINGTSRKAYANRTVLFLKDDGTLAPIAIELALPHPNGDLYEFISRVVLPTTEGAEGTIWQLAKAYVVVNDTGFHQLVSHWLNTHAVMEPFVIATNRQLSALHPIFKLLHPHFHDNLYINALARQNLISADGTIENAFLPGKYSMEMSSVVYKSWNFREQALPADLIKRGMAVEDSTSPHGLRLVIEDYPFAVDGLLIWDAISKWVRDYVSYYYESDDIIKQDSELQSWWKELVEVGHADLKDKEWWPKMQTRGDLIESCTIIIWIASALHAAINFGQYPYGGYILNRPTLSRRLIPDRGTPEYEELVTNPQLAFLKTITPKYETLLDLSVIEILSGHTTDEVYLGTRNDPYWTSDSKALEAFKIFGDTLAEIEKTLISRNDDETLKNRLGPVLLPYTLLYPSSDPGLTGRGIPNSVSI